jgi:hypothetical protein
MSEEIGSIYTTKIPSLDEAADIQVALKLYHYGQSSAPATLADLPANSVAGHLNTLQEDLDALDTREASRGIGQVYQNEEPTSPVDNFIWVKADSSPVSVALLPTSRYQTTSPTTDLTPGLLWVDSDSSPLKIYVYSGSAWREIGA